MKDKEARRQANINRFEIEKNEQQIGFLKKWRVDNALVERMRRLEIKCGIIKET